MQETQDTGVQPLGGEDPLEEEMAMHSSIFACKIPWTEEPDGLQSMGAKAIPWAKDGLFNTWSLGNLKIHKQNNRMGKTRDLIKKFRDTKGTFHAKMGSIRDRNGRDLTEAKYIKKRWQKYTEELYKKDLHDPDNHDGVITHLEPDILVCEVKWA